MTNNVGALDGEQTLSEMHERERLAFQTQLEHQQAIVTGIFASAGVDFAHTDVWKAVGYAIHVATFIGGVAAARAVIKRW